MHALARVFMMAGLLALTSGVVHAQSEPAYPSKPVRLIVGFTPGSATDITARIFAQRFSEMWGVAVTVDNVPGAGGTVGAARAAKAAPDGYTLKYGANGALAIAPSLFSTGITKGIPDEFAEVLTKDAAFPKRMGRPEEYGKLAVAIVENPMLNGCCIRLDAGTRFAPK